jgi:hypothetical protein
MPLPPITRFSAIDTKASPTNKNNGLYAPELNQAQIDSIPTKTKHNGGIWYNTGNNTLEARINNNTVPLAAGNGNVSGPANAANNNIAVFDGTTGKVIKDSGVSINKVPVLAPSFRDAAFSMAPVNVNEIGNLGHIRFINDVSSIYVDTLTSLRFFPYNDQVCSVFTSEVGSGGGSTSESALLEIHTDSGALLLSRLTTSQRDGLGVVSGIDGTNGMLLFNTDTLTFNGYDGTNWRTIPQLNTDGRLDLNNKNIINLLDPLNAQDAATKAFVEAAVSGIPTATITLAGDVTGSGLVTSPITTTLALTLDQIKAPVANVSLSNKNITNLLDPTTAQQAATKNYVDTRTITLSGAVSGSGALGTTITTTLANITVSQISDFNTAVVAFRLDQFAIPTSNINLNNQKIINLATPTASTDATNKTYVDTRTITLSGAVTGSGNLGTTIATTLTNITTSQITNFNSAVTAFRLDQFAAPTASLNLNSQKIISLATPTVATDAANKSYVDTAISGSGFAPGTSKYIIQTTDPALPNAQSLASLSPGLLKTSFLGTGVLVTATPGTDYYSLGNPTRILDNADNFFIGTNAGNNNAGTLQNTAVGVGALAAITSGAQENVAVGRDTLKSATTGGANVGIGYNALTALTTSTRNVAVGAASLSALTTGVQNVSVGASALNGITTTSDNISIGYNSGQATGLISCLFIGTTADASTNGLTNAIAIGAGALVNASNCMVLGSTGTSVGIGGITPNAQLQLPTTHANRKIVLYETANNNHQVDGFGTAAGIFRFQLDATTSSYTFNAGVNSTTSNELMRLTGTGFLGIGTASPNAQIHLGDTAVNRKIVLYGGGNDHQFYGFGVNNSILRLQVDSTSADYVFYAATSSTTSNELMRIKGDGKVGIGTAIPDQLLTVNSSTPSKIAAGSWAAFSDARIKDIVGDYEHGLAEIIQIKTRKFKYNNRSGYPEVEQAKVNIGVIAQEIEEIFPECIVEKMEHLDIPDMRLYDGTALTYALINAVKELNNEIINLKQQINNKR